MFAASELHRAHEYPAFGLKRELADQPGGGEKRIVAVWSWLRSVECGLDHAVDEPLLLSVIKDADQWNVESVASPEVLNTRHVDSLSSRRSEALVRVGYRWGGVRPRDDEAETGHRVAFSGRSSQHLFDEGNLKPQEPPTFGQHDLSEPVVQQQELQRLPESGGTERWLSSSDSEQRSNVWLVGEAVVTGIPWNKVSSEIDEALADSSVRRSARLATRQ